MHSIGIVGHHRSTPTIRMVDVSFAIISELLTTSHRRWAITTAANTSIGKPMQNTTRNSAAPELTSAGFTPAGVIRSANANTRPTLANKAVVESTPSITNAELAYCDK